MTFQSKTLLFGKYLFLAQITKNNTLNVSVREFTNSVQSDYSPSWNQTVSINLSVNRVKSKSGDLPNHEHDQSKQHILSFDSAEDNLSGIIRPTLIIKIPDQNNSSSIVFIVVLSQLTNIQNEMIKKWSLVPIKKLKVSNNHVCRNTVFIDQLSFIFTKNGQMVYCYGDRDCVVPFNLIQQNDKAEEIVHLSSRHYNGECLIIGVYMVQEMEDITDDNSSSIFKLFVKKSRHNCKSDVEFIDLDPSDFLPEDYASCITSIYINYIEYCNHTDSLICSKTVNHITIMSNIFIVLSSGYLLEFSSGQLILSLCLTHLYRSLSCDENASTELTIVEGVIQSDNRKLVILKSFNNCVSIDTATQKVHQHWSDVEYVFIGDILSRGSDQLLLIFQSLEHDVDLQHWFLTDFNTIFIDKRQDVSEELMSKDSNSRFLSAKNALQQQLSRMKLAVENAESRLKDKVEFLKINLSRIQRKTAVPVLLKQKDYMAESKETENDVISVNDVWNQTLDDQLVVGVTVINKSSRCLSGISISLVNKDSSSILQTTSTWHLELSSPPDLSFTTLSSDGKHSVKKLKVDGKLKQTNVYCDLLPNQEVFLTLCCSLSNLSNIPKDTITITLFLRYCCHANSDGHFEDVKEHVISSIQMCSRFSLLLREILQNAFTDQLLHGTHLENSIGTLHHRKLCLKTIQHCTRLNFETKYGLLNHIDHWLNKIPNLIYHPKLCCYIYTGSGLLCLVRLEVILASNLKQAEVKVYTRNDQQFNLFMQFLSSYLPDNISYKMASTKYTNIRINRFLISACEEIETGISLSNQFYKDTNMKEELNLDLINQESVHRFQNQFENEKKILCSNSLERTQPDLVLTQLRNVEEITDRSVGNILSQNVDSNNVLR